MKRAQGSVIPYVAVLLLVLVLSVQYVYSAYKLSNESTRLQNTADAAIYSSAVAAAQDYNFMALSNRAMVANQITIAQLTTMMSWMRMLRTFSGTIESIAQYFPYVGQIITAIDYWIGFATDLVENLMPGLQGVVEVYLYELSQKQRLMQAVSPVWIVDIMQEVVEKNDSDVDYSFATLSLLSMMAQTESLVRNDCQTEATAASNDGVSTGNESDDVRFRCRQFRNVVLASKDGFTRDRLYSLAPPGMGDGIRIPGVGAGRHPSDYPVAMETVLTLMRAGGTTMTGASEDTPFGTWTALDTISIHGRTRWAGLTGTRTVNYDELVKMGSGFAISGDESYGQRRSVHEGTAYWNTNPLASMCADPWHGSNFGSSDPKALANAVLDFLSTGELSCSQLRDEYQEDISDGRYGGLQPFADFSEKGLIQDRDHLMIYLRKNRQHLKAYSATDFGSSETRIDVQEGAVMDSLHAAAAATVTFRRDSDRWMLERSLRGDRRIEFGNTYNPFWEARLDPLTLPEKASVVVMMNAGRPMP